MCTLARLLACLWVHVCIFVFKHYHMHAPALSFFPSVVGVMFSFVCRCMDRGALDSLRFIREVYSFRLMQLQF